VILVWLDGGPSALETFDPRPDAPADLRGPLGAIRTGVPGLALGARMPRMAARMDQATLVRTFSHGEAVHHRACRALLTASPAGDANAAPRPLGSVAAARFDRTSENPYVVVGNSGFASGYGRGGECEPVEMRPDSRRVANLLRREPARIREQYGPHRFGRSCLLARKLVEQGARFVAVPYGGWDAHCDAVEAAREWLVPTLDQGLAALLSDLSQRGMLDRTLVVVAGEFGRSPRLNALGGRDHSPAAGFALLAGASVPRGKVIGRVDPSTGEPCGSAVTPVQLTETILGKLGIPGYAPDSRFC
jgi:hypothetical protein